MLPCRLSVLIGLLLCGSCLATPTTRPQSHDIASLIRKLSDRNGAVRDRAGAKLTALGAAARPALLEALRHGNPERRSRAAAILMRLPWSVPDDSSLVKRDLEHYGELDEQERSLLVGQLYEKLHASATLLRLLKEDPSNDVRWTIVGLLSENDDDPAMGILRKMNLSDADAPMLRLAGQAWYYFDRKKSLALLRRAIESESRSPTSNIVTFANGRNESELTYAFDRLIDDALVHRRFGEAANWLRRQIPAEIGAKGTALPQLVALHIGFGPLKGLEQDLATWGTDRQLVHRIVEQLNTATRAPATHPAIDAEVLERAFGLTEDDRLAEAYFLFAHKFYDAARSQVVAVEARNPPRDQRQVKVQLLLWMIAAAQNQDQRAADTLQRAMMLMSRAHLHLGSEDDQWSEDDLWVEVYWRRARAAHNRGDAQATKDDVANLLRYSPDHPDAVIAIVKWLKDAGYLADARIFFQRAYLPAQARLAQSPDDPVAMNDLAWLEACCDERVSEAFELSQRAVARQPDSSAFLDTAAEANFAAGNRARAIELETRALQFRPLDEFMQSQLTRFKTARLPATTQSGH